MSGKSGFLSEHGFDPSGGAVVAKNEVELDELESSSTARMIVEMRSPMVQATSTAASLHIVFELPLLSATDCAASSLGDIVQTEKGKVMKSQNGRTVIKTMFYIHYELEMWLPSEGAWTLNRSRPRERGHVPSLVVSVGSVFACHLVVGPFVELLCGSTPGPEIPIKSAIIFLQKDFNL
jgi:hypothetical protein